MKKSSKLGLIATGVTMLVFTTEAIIHWNMGVNENNGDKKFKFQIPPTDELLKLVLVVGAFSVANGYLISGATKLIENTVKLK